jgi:hypothetical protein
MAKVKDYREVNFDKLVSILEERKVKYYLVNDEWERYVLYDEEDAGIEWGLVMHIMGQTIQGARYDKFRDAINECIDLNCIHSSNGFDARVYIEPYVVEVVDYIIEDIVDLMEVVEDYEQCDEYVDLDLSDLDDLLFL